jgi:hypothetical protein
MNELYPKPKSPMTIGTEADDSPSYNSKCQRSYEQTTRSLIAVMNDSFMRDEYVIPPWHRKADAWKLGMRQQLIHSLVKGYYVGTFILLKHERRLELDDGLQRLSAIKAYILGEFPMIIREDEYNHEKEYWVYYNKLPTGIVHPPNVQLKIMSDETRDYFNSIDLLLVVYRCLRSS